MSYRDHPDDGSYFQHPAKIDGLAPAALEMTVNVGPRNSPYQALYRRIELPAPVAGAPYAFGLQFSNGTGAPVAIKVTKADFAAQ